MDEPKELSILEIRNYMLIKGGKITNHQLVKYFRRFLTSSQDSIAARKQFKTYVNILSTIKNEGNEKYLILRKKYYNEIPTEDFVSYTDSPMSPGSRSLISINSESSEASSQQQRQDPPPYRQPPDVKPLGLEPQTKTQYKECVEEFVHCISSFASRKNSFENIIEDVNPPMLPPRKRSSDVRVDQKTISRQSSLDQSEKNESNKENTVCIESSGMENEENKISVKQAMMKFNRYASDEEAKIPSPIGKNKKPDKLFDDNNSNNTENLSKSKEWMVSASRGNYQELAKLALESPNLIKLQDPNTGYTALHWGAKHGNENVVKLIAGTYRGNVNIRTNGGYTPLHIAMQFGRNDIFELLCNVYKADRDLLDWSGKKALEYQKQMTSVSASTYSKIKARKKHSEKDLGFLRIGSLNVRVKKTTEAFSNFLGVGNNIPRMPQMIHMRATAPPSTFEKFELKSWGSADTIQDPEIMPPPKFGPKKRRSKRESNDFSPSQSESFTQSMPTTPNQQRALYNQVKNDQVDELYDSDTAYGFDNNWYGHRSLNGDNSQDLEDTPNPTYI